MSESATIIPIAGGKGGVGKTLLTANLAIALARRGHPTLAIDLDFGGSNLHSFLGLANDNPGIGDFLMARSAELAELPVATEFANLSFLPGDGQTPFMANLSYAHKMRLIRAIRRLPARYILLDLGAGSAFNTLDFFQLADKGLLVTTPDLPAIMNLMVFLKNFVMRLISREANRSEQTRQIMAAAQRLPLRAPALTVEALLDQVAAVDPNTASQLRVACAGLTPRLVFNMAEQLADLEFAAPMETNLRQRLGLEVECGGLIFYDRQVRRSVQQRRPLLAEPDASLAGQCIEALAERIASSWEQPWPDSRQQLHSTTSELQGRWQQTRPATP